MPVNASQTNLVCTGFTEYVAIISVFIFSRSFLMLPLGTFILHRAYQRWRPNRSFQGCGHSDMLTFNVAFLEMIWAVVLVLYVASVFSPHLIAVMVSCAFCSYIIFCGQTGFHIMACLQRYMAVVHPLVYRRVGNSCIARIRNVLVSGVWAVSLLLSSLLCLSYPSLPEVPLMVLLVSPLVLISISSVRILCVLIGPGPGKDKASVDHSKDKALFLILVILGVLCFSLFGFLTPLVLKHLEIFERRLECVVMASGYWCSIPSSLVQPLLYLRRTRTWPPCCSTTH